MRPHAALLGGDGDDEPEPRCGHLSWFGPGQRESCDVSVGEFESCWKRMAEWAGSYSCERPATFSYAKNEEVSDCFAKMEARCENFDDF